MFNKNTKKGAFLSSLVALVLCCSMFVGTTFAWFTDEVTSGMNTIAAGNLDVELLANGEKVNSNTKLFDDVDLWEPGVVVYENLQVANVGTLALKYQMTLNFGNENNLNGHKLSEVLKIAVIDKIADNATREEVLAKAKASENVGTLNNFYQTGMLAPKDQTVTIDGESIGDKSTEQTIVIFWEPNDNDTDNLYNANNGQKTSDGEPLHIEFGVHLVATQLMSEEDSFGNDYDEDAPHTLVTTADELIAAVAEGGYIMLKEDIELSDILVVNKSGTVINGDGNVLTSTAGRAINISGANGVTITNLTIDASGERAINVIQNSTNVEIDNVTATSANYTVNVAASAGDAKVAVSNSTITGLNAINVAGAGAYVTVDNSVVNCEDNSSKEGYSAICLNKDATNGTIIVTGTQINITGTDTSGSFVAHNEADNGYISIDGSTDDVVVAVAYISYGENYYSFESLEEAIEKATDKDTVGLLRDIELTETVTIAAGETVIVDLNGKNISGTFSGTGNQEMFLVKGALTVKNGEVVMTATQNQGWNAMAAIFDVTAGGVLNMEDVTANVSGTDMNFIVHLNNWGTASLHVNECDFTTTYCGVRVFNSGNDMNTVTIKDTDFHGGRMFWVHNYTAEGKDDSTLTLDIYGNNNTSDHAKPVRFGFSNAVYYTVDGDLIEN